MKRMVAWVLISMAIGATGAALAQSGEAMQIPPRPQADYLLPFDGRWEYPHFTTFRPGHGQASNVNPPRMSWPYLPSILLHTDETKTTIGHDANEVEVATHVFTLQMARKPDFAKPEIEIRNTPYNFYNALGPLEKATWYWRVGYDVGTSGEQWSQVRSFTIAADAVDWDRRAIERAVEILKDRGHPRVGPPKGDWAAWRQALEKNPTTKHWLDETLEDAEGVLKEKWWNDFPKTDAKGKSAYDKAGAFNEISQKVALAVFVYRLTGDKRFQKARNHLMVLASYPYGGRSSPEYHGARSKWATQIVRHMAFCYDWLYDELNEAGRKQLRAAIDWRLRAVYLQKNSWMRGKNIAQSGVAVFASSHPYENLNWAMPAVILTAGDSAVASELLPLCLNYLTGVTAAHGPDEAWNEGMSYGSAKSYAMLRASMCAAIALPELQVAENPVYDRLLEWFSHLTPIGLERHSFGEYASGVDTRRATILRVTRALTWLTQDGRGRERWLALAKEVGDNVRTTPHLHRWSYSPWVELLGATYFATPEPKKNGTAMLFPDAGWAFALSGSIANRKKFDNGSGMLFQCRPMGGYSHSYRAEGDFVWHAYGQTVGTSGGRMAYPDPHSRDSMSHNVIMVNGIGQRWGPFDDYRTGWWKPGYPFHGRMIAWRERPGFVHWVGDATHAYQSIPDLLRWHRHVVFVAGKWFAIYDDLAMRPGADPARFSWLYHIYPDLQIARDEKGIGFSYQMENVHARVAMGNPAEELEFVDMRDIDGFKNPLTGFDYQPVRVKALRMKGRDDRKAGWMAHNIWITNKEPAAQYAFLTALTAWREGEKAPKVDFDRTRKVTVTMSDGEARSVSFAEGVAGDVTVDVGTIRAHAIATDPGVLPPSDPRGMHATVAAGGKTVDAEWLLSERFEDGPVTLARWKTEGNAEVSALNGRLLVRPVGSAGGDVGSVVWFRPEIPAGSIVRMILDAKSGGDSPELVLMWGAREPTGVPLRFTRAGRAKDYADVFHAEAALPTGGEKMQVTLLVGDKEDSVLVNGKPVAVKPGGARPGRFGFRVRNAEMRCEEVRVGRLR